VFVDACTGNGFRSRGIAPRGRGRFRASDQAGRLRSLVTISCRSMGRTVHAAGSRGSDPLSRERVGFGAFLEVLRENAPVIPGRPELLIRRGWSGLRITRRKHRAAVRNGSDGSLLAKYPADRILTSRRSNRYCTGYSGGRKTDEAAPCDAFWLRLGPLLQLLHLALCSGRVEFPPAFLLRRPEGALA